MIGLIAATLTSLSHRDLAAKLESWGSEALETIRRDFLLPGNKSLYAESFTPSKPLDTIAFNWSCGVWLSALNSAAEIDDKYKPWLKEFAAATRGYWNTEPPVPGYDELPGPKKPDRYYDDNEWMVMALAETSLRLKDRKYREWAQGALDYALSGEDAKLGGGLYWRERDKASKNTCSNAPGAAACLAVYRLHRDRRLLAKAADLYAWTKRTLRDPSDYLMWDNVNLGGKIERTKWSYNTALMIRSACELFTLTRNRGYRVDAIAMTKASLRKWLVDGKLADEGRFAHLLVEAWTYVKPATKQDLIPWPEIAGALEYLHEHTRTAEGYYPSRWNAPLPPQGTRVELLDQAAFARACFVTAKALR